jgi:hypothetical protein
VSSTTGHRGGTHGHQRWTREAGDLDLSPPPPPPPTRAPRLVSLQSTTKPRQLPPSPRRRRPPCPDRRGARTPTRCRIPCPCRTVCPLPPHAGLAWVEWRSNRSRGWPLLLLVRVSIPGSLGWNGMDSLALLVSFVFLLHSNPSVSISRFVSSRISFAAWRCGNLGPRISFSCFSEIARSV